MKTVAVFWVIFLTILFSWSTLSAFANLFYARFPIEQEPMTLRKQVIYFTIQFFISAMGWTILTFHAV